MLATAGASLSDVVDLTCFLVDMKDYKGFNSVYDQYFSAATGEEAQHRGGRGLTAAAQGPPARPSPCTSCRTRTC